MQHPRLPRFKRANNPNPIELTERDHQIIRLINQYRFLRSSHILNLLSGSPQSLLRRLQLLYHHGFLERPRAQLEYYHQGGSRQIAYGLGNKGGTLLKHDGVGISPSRWGEKNRAIGRIFLEHALLVSDVLVALVLACRKNSHVRLLSGQNLFKTGENQPSLRWNVIVEGGIKLGVIPDRVFGVEFQDADGKTKRSYFFLEADRGTMPVIRGNLKQTSFFRKLLAYEATWSQSIHRTRFGFHRFRVLTVTKSAARVNSLVDACSKLKRGHGLFLFADKSVLEQPAELFSPIWQTGRQGETGSLLD